MSAEPEVLYIDEVAARIGKTAVATRAAARRDQKRKPDKRTLPPMFKIGTDWACRVVDFDAWLKKKAGR